MIETEDLILDKAEFLNWMEMYDHVWSRPESAKYMAWEIAASAENAKIRIMKTIAFQKEHDAYIVFEKSRRNQTLCISGIRDMSGAELCEERVWQADSSKFDSERLYICVSRIISSSIALRMIVPA